MAGVAVWLNEKYHLEGDRKVDKHSEVVSYIKSWIDNQYDNGRVSVIGADEIDTLVNKFVTGESEGSW